MNSVNKISKTVHSDSIPEGVHVKESQIKQGNLPDVKGQRTYGTLKKITTSNIIRQTNHKKGLIITFLI